MRIVFGNFNFIRPAGTETYVMTVVPRLVALGHEATVYSMAVGPLADEVRRRGVVVTDDTAALPESCDVVFAQDAPTSYALAERYPGVPQVFVCHSTVFDTSHPPRLDALVHAIVVLNGRTEAHMRAFARGEAEIVRLNQPVDVERFAPRRPLSPRPERALLLSNYLRGARRDVLADALAAEGIELVEIGRHAGSYRTDVENVMNEADVVIGRGRVMVEAMACGRAAYLYDVGGTDGWVTGDSYAAMAENNFSGQATDLVPDAGAIRAGLRAYDPEMGLAARDLAYTHHHHNHHAEALVELFGRVAGGSGAAVPGPLGEMTWLARQNWILESRAYDLGLEAGRLHEALRDGAEAARAAGEAGYAREAALAAERQAAHEDAGRWVERALEAERQAEELRVLSETRRYRLVAALAKPIDALRRRS